jgi:hypothetical protein
MTERELKAEVRNLKSCLTALVMTVEQVIRLVDVEMDNPSGQGRGRAIARLMNALEMGKDQAKRFGLRIGSGGKPIRKKRAVKGGSS